MALSCLPDEITELRNQFLMHPMRVLEGFMLAPAARLFLKGQKSWIWVPCRV